MGEGRKIENGRWSVRSVSRLLLILSILFPQLGSTQVITILEDFEGLADHQTDFSREGIFSYGSLRLRADQGPTTGSGYSGQRAMQVVWTGKEYFGGWGKGLGLIKELNRDTDHLCFHILAPTANGPATRFRVVMEEEDAGGGAAFDHGKDDRWGTEITITNSDSWQPVCIPLSQFEDMNAGGDGILNMSHAEGRIFSVGFDFFDIASYSMGNEWHFDFLCFSRGPLPTEDGLFAPVTAPDAAGCLVGAWSEEGNRAAFIDIPGKVEWMMNCQKERKLDVVSIYKPFAVNGKRIPSLLPPVEQLNALADMGYLPMVTFEAQFAREPGDDHLQPNLYSVTEGWFDKYFEHWALRIREVKGDVLVRIFHEFNGDWYPWCIARNDKDSELYIRAFRRVVDIFRGNGADNVRFVWCPNSMSSPQQGWNNFMNAYPGDAYVDIVGLDVFNGAGQQGVPVWKSFRYEIADSYFILTQQLPHKPLMLCETSSRERMVGETGHLLQKSDWMREQADALRRDCAKVRLSVWFNEYDGFKLDSSPEAEDAFRRAVWEHPYFQSGSRKGLGLR